MKNITTKIKKYTPIDEIDFLDAIIGFKKKPIKKTPIREYCTRCKEVRERGRCINNQCKYYDK